jgi:hypothetical protein
MKVLGSSSSRRGEILYIDRLQRIVYGVVVLVHGLGDSKDQHREAQLLGSL